MDVHIEVVVELENMCYYYSFGHRFFGYVVL